MPMFEYRCDSCNEVIEVLLRWPPPDISEHPCAFCEGTMRRQASAPAFRVDGFNAGNNYGLKEKK